MMKIEWFSAKEIMPIAAGVLLWVVSSFLLYQYTGPQTSYLLMIMMAIAIASLMARIVDKPGAITATFAISALLTQNLPTLGVVGIDKILSLVGGALVIEATFYAMLAQKNNKEASYFMSQVLGAASIPLISSFIVSISISLQNTTSLANLVILSGLSGAVGSVVGMTAWYYLKTTKRFIQVLTQIKE